MSDPGPGVESGSPRKPASLLENSAWVFLSQALSVAISGGVSIYAIRTLAPADWGEYSTAFALVTVFTVVSGLGLSQLALREMSQAPERSATLLNQAYTTLLVTTGCAAGALVLAAFALGYPRRVLVLIGIVGALLLLDPFLGLVQAAFAAYRVFVYVSVFQMARTVVYGLAAAVVLWRHDGVVGLAVATVCAAVVAMAIALFLLRTRLHMTPSLDFQAVGPLVRGALAFAGIGVVGIVYDRVDVLMLSVLSGAKGVAHYTVPYGWVKLTWLIPSIVGAAFFPVLAQAVQSDREKARDLFVLVMRLFLFLSLPLSLLIAIGSPAIVEGVFGHAYHPSVRVLEVMAWTSVLGFENYALWYAVVVARREKLVLGLQAVGLAVNVGVNAILIPKYGPMGAAFALLVSDLVVVTGMAVVVDRSLFPLPFAHLLTKPALAAAIAVPSAVALARIAPLLGAVVGSVGAAAILIAVRYIKPAEWKPLAARVFRRTPATV